LSETRYRPPRFLRFDRPEPKDPFRRHRLALSVVTSDLTVADLSRILREVTATDASSFADFLFTNGLTSYWHDHVLAKEVAEETTSGFINALKRGRSAEAAFYLSQKSALWELDRLFDSESIIYAAIKGAHVRELVYADPALRPATDIDILISPDQRETAARALLGAGFELHADAENISHEANFTRGPLAIDLHWDILRPGRTRVEMAQSMLSRRQRIDDFWGLDDTDTVFLMLVHPAFAKYVCSPNMGLIRVVDFILWLRRRPVDWDAVAERLHDTGLKVAAWTVLQWLAILLEPKSVPVPGIFIDEICPGPSRARYLTYWLRNDLPTRWFDKPLLIQLGFTLPLHDRPSDAQRAIAGWMQARRTRGSDPLLQVND
jgi:hypothetical protein